MAIDIDAFKDGMTQIRLNPSLVQDHVFDMVDKLNEGEIELVDPSTPFNNIITVGCSLFAASMQEIETTTRDSYIRLVDTERAMYNHMEDPDLVNRFATPSRANFIWLFAEYEIRQKAVPIPGTDIRKITIPRNTNVTVNGVTFTMLYPIDIKVMPHGGIEATYDFETINPIQTPKSNIVDLSVVMVDRTPMIRLNIEMLQLRINTQKFTVNAGSTTTQRWGITGDDTFYYARVFVATEEGGWEPLATTYSEFNYDISVPTAVLAVVDKSIELRIPIIYTTNNALTNRVVRVDLYTTRGYLNMDLIAAGPDSYDIHYQDLDSNVDSTYSAPLTNFAQQLIVSSDTTRGGRGALTKEETRRRIITNMTQVNTPITASQTGESFRQRHYDMLLAKDVPGERTFLATRYLPKPDTTSLVPAIGGAIELFETSFSQLSGIDTVMDNGKRMTIKPETLFVYRDGRVVLVGDNEMRNLRVLSPDQLVNQVNNNVYLYTPFHYVLDSTGKEFQVRPYYIHKPKTRDLSYIEANETLGIDVNVRTINVDKTEYGFELIVVCQSNQGWQELRDDQCFAQLAFQPRGETAYAFVNGELLPQLINNERAFLFRIETNWDIDDKHNLIVNNFTMLNDIQRNVPVQLDTVFNIGFAASGLNQTPEIRRPIDGWIGTHILPYGTRGISRHSINIKLGDNLERLWSNGRAVPGSQRYDTWEETVYATYTEDVPKRKPNGDLDVTVKDGKVVYNWEARKGDPIIDPVTGAPKVKHEKGSIKVDATGNPAILYDRQIIYHIDMFMLDGTFYFATSDKNRDYIIQVASEVVGWVETDIAEFQAEVFEETQVYFYPKRNIGMTNIVVSNGRQVNLQAAQPIHVVVDITQVNYLNDELRAQFERTASGIISEYLTKRTVSISDIISKLRTIGGDDILGVSMDGFGSSADIYTYTALDDSMRCSVSRKLAVLPEGTTEVIEDITFDYAIHKLDNVYKA